MSKKGNALGSIPTFENVARATGELDLFKEDTETKAIKENAGAIEENEPPIEVITKQEQEDLKKKILEETFKQQKADTNERNIKKEDAKIIETFKKEQKEPKTKQPKQQESTKKGLRTGYKRQTFVIREDQLEMIQALCSYNNVMQLDLLEALIEKGLADINEDIKAKALASYRKEQSKDKTEEAKKGIAKLFN